jgi:hypothetical protein
MATEIIGDAQSTIEIRKHVFDFTNDLLTGVTISSATATHVPPSGTASTPTIQVSSPLVYVTLGVQTVVGNHYLSCVATLSDGEKSEIRALVAINW